MVQRILTDDQWVQLEALLPAPATGPGRPPSDRRRVIDGILWRYRTGAPWRALPQEFGVWQTIYSRFRLWQQDGTWTRVLQQLQRDADARGEVDWDLHCIDATSIRAHQHAAGGKKGAIMPSAVAGVGLGPNSTFVQTKPAS
jgi:transposase